MRRYWLELAVLAVWIAPVMWLWANWPGSPKETDIGERQLGLSVIHAQLNGVVTGASIVLAGVGAMVGIAFGRLQKTPEAVRNLRECAFWAVLALGLALYTMGTLPTLITTENPVKVAHINVMATTSLAFVSFAGWRLFKSVWAAIVLRQS